MLKEKSRQGIPFAGCKIKCEVRKVCQLGLLPSSVSVDSVGGDAETRVSMVLYRRDEAGHRVAGRCLSNAVRGTPTTFP